MMLEKLRSCTLLNAAASLLKLTLSEAGLVMSGQLKVIVGVPTMLPRIFPPPLTESCNERLAAPLNVGAVVAKAARLPLRSEVSVAVCRLMLTPAVIPAGGEPLGVISVRFTDTNPNWALAVNPLTVALIFPPIEALEIVIRSVSASCAV